MTGYKILTEDNFSLINMLSSKSLILLALAIVTSTGRCELTTQIDCATVNSIANAIFRSENSRKHPYGVMIPTKDPRRVCINTINHAWVDFERQSETSATRQNNTLKGLAFTLPFISFLGQRYCPPSVDPVGFHNWTNNVWRILNHK